MFSSFKVHMSILRFQSGQFSEDMIPTVGFNMRKITKGNVTIKVGNYVKQFEIEKKEKRTTSDVMVTIFIQFLRKVYFLLKLFSLSKQSQRSRSILQDGSRSLRLFWKRKFISQLNY